jgi:hypothetical protein
MFLFLNGLPSSGKDTTANYLVEKYNFTKLSLATPLKEQTKDIFNITNYTLEELEEVKDIETHKLVKPLNLGEYKTYRQAIIGAATASRKFLGDEIYTYSMIERIKNTLRETKNPNIVIADLGFLQEQKLLMKFAEGLSINAYTVRINSEWVNTNLKTDDSRVLLDYDFIVNATKDRVYDKELCLPELYLQIDRLINHLKITNICYKDSY